MKKAIILNEHLSDNLGDQAIGRSMSEFVTSKGYDAETIYLSNPLMTKLPEYAYSAKKGSVRAGNSLKSILSILIYFVRYRNQIKELIFKIKPDILVIGGGQLFNASKTWEVNGFSISIFWWTYLVRKYSPDTKIYAVAVGMASNHNIIERFLNKRSINRTSGIWVRDNFSKNEMLKTYKKEVKVIPDIAFYRSGDVIRRLEVKYKLLLGIANYTEVFLRYNEYKSREEYYEDVIRRSRMLDFIDGVALFYTTRRDVIECTLFQKHVNELYGKQIPIIETKNLDQLISVMKETNVVSSGRMHGLILGMKYGCKVLPYPISNKLKAFSDEYVSGEDTGEYSIRIEKMTEFN